MTTEVWSWMGGLAAWMLTYALHSTVILGATWGVTRMGLVRSPRSREVLWMAAVLGGVVTATAKTVDFRASEHVEVRVRLARMESVRVDGPLLAVPEDGWVQEMPAPTLSDRCDVALRGPGRGGDAWMNDVRRACLPASGIPWQLPVVSVWLTGILILGWREGGRYRELRRIRRGLAPANARTRLAVTRVADGLAVGRVRVATSHEVDGPCVVGVRTVALPRRCQEDLPDAELAAVLAHEVAHVVRRDALRQAVLRWAGVLLWMQPLNRLALEELRGMAELICDDWAMARIRCRVDLARSISRVAEWAVPGRGAHPVLVASQGGSPSVRVRRILSGVDVEQGSRLWPLLVAGSLMAGVMLMPPVPVPGRSEGVFVLGDTRVESMSGAVVGEATGGLEEIGVRVIRLSGR